MTSTQQNQTNNDDSFYKWEVLILAILGTFMAILELARLGRVAVAQEANFGPMWLYPGDGHGAMAPAETAEEPVSPDVDDVTGRESETHGTT